MVDIRIGRHGVLILLVVFVLLGIEDIRIWINTGSLPAVEFFIAAVLVLGVVAAAIREAMAHYPPGRS